MRFFNADGTVRHDSQKCEVFGWIWKDLNEEKYMMMTVYNADGSVRSVEYYDECRNWEIVTNEEIEHTKPEDNTNEDVTTIKWYQRTISNIEENNKTRLSNLLINLNTRESNLVLPIVNASRFASLVTTPQATATTTHPFSLDINDGIAKMLRLKRLHEIFNVSSKVESLKRPYDFFDETDSVYEVNKCIDYYLEEVAGLRDILFYDAFPRRSRRDEVDTGPSGIEIDEGWEPYADIDQTLLKLFDKTCEMHCEVEKIRKCFLLYEKKLQSLLEKYRTTREDMFENQYLDKVILILDDKMEKVKHSWPFKIGHVNPTATDINLIV